MFPKFERPKTIVIRFGFWATEIVCYRGYTCRVLICEKKGVAIDPTCINRVAVISAKNNSANAASASP